MLKRLLISLSLLATSHSIICAQAIPGGKTIMLADTASSWPLLVDAAGQPVVATAARLLAEDMVKLGCKPPQLISTPPNSAPGIIVLGVASKSKTLTALERLGKINLKNLRGKWEAYHIQMVAKPFANVAYALVIAGSDARGAAYGALEMCRRWGVSPWHWWADVPVAKNTSLTLPNNLHITDSPLVKYRGIFINDEAPALSNWSREKFGGFNHRFYETVFELMLRLKANYLWPAMWGNAFYDDDSLNMSKATEYGMVIGTSHHEPMMRAHDEWRRYGKGQKWNYDSTTAALQQFWRSGLQRATNEKIVTVGMRGDGDEPMSRETATALLERIVADQRKIITEVTRKPAAETPQLWALYKEVQDYYDKGMRVPDDVTLLLCDDNWGNIRRLPALNDKPRKGGYGIYYHFDYVGGPRNYKWVNTNHISRVWEQMHLAWAYNARQIWIVNVGDIKPMEFPISFFLDYAWNPTRIGPDDLTAYTTQWAEKQFGSSNAALIANCIDSYSKKNSRRKPELLDANTYSFNYNEWYRAMAEYDILNSSVKMIKDKLPAIYHNAFYQLVEHPVKACNNLYQLYYAAAQNKRLAQNSDTLANYYARQVKKYYEQDSLITQEYHALANGKWNHMMSQTHIGYTYWQQPAANKIPATEFVWHYNHRPANMKTQDIEQTAKASIPKEVKDPVYYEAEKVVSIQVAHYTRKYEAPGVQWKLLPRHGLTGDAITTWPVTHGAFAQDEISPWLEYDFYTNTADSVEVQLRFSPTLNLWHLPAGLQFEVSLNDWPPKVLSLNEKDFDSRTWESWAANNSITVCSKHLLAQAGRQTIRYRPLHPAIVLQQIVANLGGLQYSYLGPPETSILHK